jgi:hypothetical protein
MCRNPSAISRMLSQSPFRKSGCPVSAESGAPVGARSVGACDDFHGVMRSAPGVDHDDCVECICRDGRRRLNELDVHAYAADHLTRVWGDVQDLTGYLCPDTGTLLVLDDPQGDRSVFGPARLRVVSQTDWDAVQDPSFRAP